MCVYMERDDELRYRASSRFLFFKNQGGGVGEGVPLALTTLICEQTDLVFNILVSIYIIYI